MSMDRLGIGFLSVFALPPLELVDLAADLGCRYISTVVQGQPLVPLGFRSYSLRDDVALRKDLLAAMNHRGVTISLGDGFLVLPDSEMRTFSADLDVLAELGVPWINAVSLDPDLSRTFDQFAALAGLAAQRNIRTAVEPVPSLTVGDLPTALAAVEHVGRPDFRLLIDAMHLVRSGSSAADLAAIDPDHIGYAQLNDTTLQPRIDNYMEEAMFERMVPGEGELPLRDILSVLPPGIVLELEVPRRSLALAGVSHIDRLRPCVEAARRLLSEIAQGTGNFRQTVKRNPQQDSNRHLN
jgi:sugar phosphate isomerase/epimerase